jgi:hypothetical protein
MFPIQSHLLEKNMFHPLIFSYNALYHWTLAGVPLVVRVPQFQEPCTKPQVSEMLFYACVEHSRISVFSTPSCVGENRSLKITKTIGEKWLYCSKHAATDRWCCREVVLDQTLQGPRTYREWRLLRTICWSQAISKQAMCKYVWRVLCLRKPQPLHKGIII